MKETFGARGWRCGSKRAPSPQSPALVYPSVPKGFTLIELAVVLVILGLTAALVLPRLFAGDEATLKSSARSLAATLRYLQDRAIATRSNYNLHVRFPDGTVTVMAATSTGEEGAVGDATISRGGLAEGVAVEDVVLTTLGRVHEGEVIVRFGMAGLQELLTLHLRSRSGAAYTVIAYPVSGKVRIEEGYKDAIL